MKTDLSSQIKLDRVARKLYHPDNEIELAALTREEKINTYIFETANDGGEYLAGQIARYINRFVAEKGKCVLALGAGTSTHSAYAALIRMYKEGKVDFSNVIVYNISEFFPLTPEGPSTMRLLNEVFLKHVNLKPENIRTIDPSITKETMYEYCRAYEESIEAEGGIQVTVCEAGPNGSLAFNEPGSTPSTSPTRGSSSTCIKCAATTRIAAPRRPMTVTMGISALRSAWEIMILYSFWPFARTVRR